jgi:oligopeptide transport system substrate-binding protein
MRITRTFAPLWLILSLLSGCEAPLNSPYPASEQYRNIFYSAFAEHPKHLDPALAYSVDEYTLIAQIYEPSLQYHYLKRPFVLTPLTAAEMPKVSYFDEHGNALPEEAPAEQIAFSEYLITLRPGIYFQPHPAFAKDAQGNFLYHRLSAKDLAGIRKPSDFPRQDTRELTAEDYVYQIKRLVHPNLHSPIAGLMQGYIVGLAEFAQEIQRRYQETNPEGWFDVRPYQISGVKVLDRYRYAIRIRGKYPQFKYWLAMPFFAPVPWEADQFYHQPLLIERNLTLDWYPVGTGPYLLAENNPNQRIVLVRNPNFHGETYPSEGEAGDAAQGLLADAGKTLPFIDEIQFILERESLPAWNKFLQGYYEASGISSDSFDQAIRFGAQNQAELTEDLKAQGIRLETSVAPSIFYLGFNMLDPVVGGLEEPKRKLRQAISIAIDQEEYISIFLNGRGIAAQGVLPPGIFGYLEGPQGINPYVYDWQDGEVKRKPLAFARRLLAEAGYPGGLDPKTGKPLLLYLDTPGGGPEDKARLAWYRKQFEKLGIELVVRATDYNRFQQKMRTGNAQIFTWGWNADYPDPENFFFLLYGPNGKVKYGGENSANYENPEFDRLFEQMRHLDDTPKRLEIIQKLEAVLRRDAPWIFGFHPKNFTLYHAWLANVKPNPMATGTLKYLRLDAQQRAAARKLWNQPVWWPLGVLVLGLLAAFLPAWHQYRTLLRKGALA